MTYDDAKKLIIPIIEKAMTEKEKILEQAKKEGTYLPGLDGNRHLYKHIDDEAQRKIKEITEQIDE